MALRVELAMISDVFSCSFGLSFVDFVVERLRQLDLLMMRMMMMNRSGSEVASDGGCYLGDWRCCFLF